MAQTRSTTEMRPPLIEVVGGNIYRRRVLKIPKMSQERLAEVSGVSLNTIAMIESARDPRWSGWGRGGKKTHPQLDTIEKLAEGLGCDPADLLRWDPERTPAFLRGKSPLLRLVHSDPAPPHPSKPGQPALVD